MFALEDLNNWVGLFESVNNGVYEIGLILEEYREGKEND